MRIIHTSDWHLGQYFFTKSRAEEHQAFLNWLIERIVEHRVDALLVAGDIFDTGSPPSYARELYNDFVVNLHKTGCQLLLMAGNHDSVATLNESKGLLSCLNAHVFTGAGESVAHQVRVINDRHHRPAAILCAVPFLRARDLVTSQAGQSDRQKQQGLQEAITDRYRRLYQYALELRQRLDRALPILASGHLTTVGASRSDAERDIYIGSLEAYPAERFPPFDYIALGHIHRAQCVAGTEHIRYSGSPIALSFDELGAAKSVFLVEFAEDKLSTVTALPIPTHRPMQLIKGTLAEIELRLSAFKGALSPNPTWVDIEIISQGYLGDLQRHIQALTADLPIEVVLLRRSKEQRQSMIVQSDKETLAELTIDEVFQRRLALASGDGEADSVEKARLLLAFQQVVDEVNAERETALNQLQNRQALLREAKS